MKRSTRVNLLLLAFAVALQANAAERAVSLPTAALPAAAPSAAAIPTLPTIPSLAAPIAAPNIAVPATAARLTPPAASAASAATGKEGVAVAAPAQNVGETVKAVAPQIQAVAAPSVSADGAAAAGQSIQAILQGGKASGGSAVDAAAPQASLSAAPAGSGLTPAAPSKKSGDGNGPAAPQGPAVKTVDSRFSYALRRAGLALAAKISGAVYSLPQGGAKLTASVLKEAAYKDAILSDIDDTLGKYNTILEKETVDAIVAVRAKGKLFAAITDRPDKGRPGGSQLGAFDTFSSVPADKREGLIVATNGGGKIYQYDAQGEPKLIYEEPNLPDAERSVVKEAAEVVKAALSGLGTGLQTVDPKDASKKFEPENHGPYGYSMILQAGTPESTVKQVAHLMEAEMKSRGLSYEVEGRMAKDATLPPYITFSKLNKSLAVKRITDLEKLQTERTILIGDSMYAPKHADKKTRLAAAAEKWAEKLSGRALPLTGNATDRNMELAMPGAMALSVGGTADPRMSNAFVLEGKGAQATRRVLNAMASRSKGAESPKEGASRIAFLILLLGVTAFAYYAMFQAFSGVIQAAPPADPNMPPGMPGDIGDLFR